MTCVLTQKANFIKNLTFMSSIKDGKPPTDMKVTKPETNEVHAPLACKSNLSAFACYEIPISIQYSQKKSTYQYRAITSPDIIVKTSNTNGYNYVYDQSKPVITNIPTHVKKRSLCQHLGLHPKAC